MEAYACAYAINAATDPDGPQCSSSHEFCFFCNMAPDPTTDTASGSDVYGSLVELVRDMAESNKEIAHIVNVVWGQYKQVQPLIVWDDAATGQRHVSPAWTKGSIRRHLLHSSQFSMFPSVIRSMFHSIIVKQNAVGVSPLRRAVLAGTRAFPPCPGGLTRACPRAVACFLAQTMIDKDTRMLVDDTRKVRPNTRTDTPCRLPAFPPARRRMHGRAPHLFVCHRRSWRRCPSTGNSKTGPRRATLGVGSLAKCNAAPAY